MAALIVVRKRSKKEMEMTKNNLRSLGGALLALGMAAGGLSRNPDFAHSVRFALAIVSILFPLSALAPFYMAIKTDPAGRLSSFFMVLAGAVSAAALVFMLTPP